MDMIFRLPQAEAARAPLEKHDLLAGEQASICACGRLVSCFLLLLFTLDNPLSLLLVYNAADPPQ
jgi:hypothetical protein